jgi:hypothetical protein
MRTKRQRQRGGTPLYEDEGEEGFFMNPMTTVTVEPEDPDPEDADVQAVDPQAPDPNFEAMINSKFPNKMVIFRHANSCNNIVKYAVWNKRKDPSLTISGLMSVLSYNPRNIDEFYKKTNKRMYVSSCVRTWMTALCLGGRNNNPTLELIVSPFLKEKGYDPGNMPESLTIQQMKFMNFLQFLKEFEKQKLTSKDLPHLKSICNCKVTVKCQGNTIFQSKTAFMTGEKQLDASKKVNIVQYCEKFICAENTTPTTEPLPEISVSKLFKEKDVSSLPSATPKMPANETYTAEMMSFYPDGLIRFYGWVTTQPTDYPVFAVAHSNVMQTSIGEFLIDKTVKPDQKNALIGQLPTQMVKEKTKSILDCNAWSVKFSCSGNQLIPSHVTFGIPKTKLKDTVANLEVLCNQDQSWAGELAGSTRNLIGIGSSHAQQSSSASKFVGDTSREVGNAIGNTSRKVGNAIGNKSMEVGSTIGKTIGNAASRITSFFTRKQGGRKRSNRRKKRRTQRRRRR